MTLRHDCPDCPYETEIADYLLDHLLDRHNYLVKAKGREVTWHFVVKALAVLDRFSDEMLEHGGASSGPFMAEVKECLYKALPLNHPARWVYG